MGIVVFGFWELQFPFSIFQNLNFKFLNIGFGIWKFKL